MSEIKPTTTKKKLFDAGIKVFAVKGYRDATVREICKKAGAANINAVNYYFGSKEKLYRDILDDIFAAYDRFDQDDWDRKTPQEQLKSMIANFTTSNWQKEQHGIFSSALLNITGEVV